MAYSYSTSLVKNEGSPPAKCGILPLNLGAVFERARNLALRLYPGPNLAESCHNHVQYLTGHLETLRPKGIRTWKTPLKEDCHPTCRRFHMNAGVLEERWLSPHGGYQSERKPSWMHASQKQWTKVPTRTCNLGVLALILVLNSTEKSFFSEITVINVRWSVTWAGEEFTKRRKCRVKFYSLSKKGEAHGVEGYTSTEGWGL